MRTNYLGIRADQVYTEGVLADTNGQVYGRTRVPNGEARSSRELLARVYQECTQDHTGPVTAAVALPGLFTQPLRLAARETVRSVLPEGCPVLLCDELEAVLAGALEGSPGLVARSDHDAAIGRVDEEGQFQRIEAEFDPLGQEGSALWLGTRTLQLAMRILEGRLPPSPRLEGLLNGHFGSITLAQLMHNMEQEAPDAEKIIALGRRTMELSTFPDPEPACRALLMRASRKFSELLEEAAVDGKEWRGVLCGSATLEAFRDEVVRQNPNISWQEGKRSPLDGCLLLAEAYADLIHDSGSEPTGDFAPQVWVRAGRQASRP